MQRPDGHVLAKVFSTDLWNMVTPPSRDRAPRFYGPPSLEAEADFVASTAHAARLFAAIPGQEAYARTLRRVGQRTWGR